jgi:RimJ/RimL family protein N-acetyltransferase
MDLTPVTLEGEAVRLEPLSLDHLGMLLEAGADAGIWRYMPSDSTSRDGMLAFINDALACQSARTALPFATVDRKSGRAIGSTRFGNIVPEHKRVEIGWTWISPRWQRSAVNTEAKFLMLRYAFETLGCNRVELKTNSLNMRSRNAILRIGAKEEGTLRSHMINPDGTLRDTVYYSILAPEWPDVKAHLEARLARD